MAPTKDTATTLFGEGFNCSQAVCAAYAPELGFSREDGLRVAAAFGGGIGRSGQTCGAVTGALMALGMKYGPVEASPQAKDRMYVIAQDFMARFNERFGALTCKDLLNADITTAEGRQSMKERNTHSTVCMGLITGAAEILDDMLRIEKAK